MLQQSAGFFKGFPCARTQLSSRRVSSAHPHTLHTSYIITHSKFPIDTEGNFFYHLQNGSFLCPQLNHLNLVRGKKAGETTFSTTYTLASSQSAAVDHFWLHLLPLKQQIQRAKVSNATRAQRLVIPLVTMQSTICSLPKYFGIFFFFLLYQYRKQHITFTPPFHTTCTICFSKSGKFAASQKFHSCFIYIFDPVVFMFIKNTF